MAWQIVLSFFAGLVIGVVIFIIILRFISGFFLRLTKDVKATSKKEVDEIKIKAKNSVRESFGIPIDREDK